MGSEDEMKEARIEPDTCNSSKENPFHRSLTLSRYARIDGLAISAMAIAGTGRIGLAGRQFAREILTEEDGNLNADPVRFNRINFSRGRPPNMLTSLHFIPPAIGRLTRMRRVRAADTHGFAPRDPSQVRDASFDGRDGVLRRIAKVCRDFTAFRSCLLLLRRFDATRGCQISRRCALPPR
jgi:hypothetical protein